MCDIAQMLWYPLSSCGEAIALGKYRKPPETYVNATGTGLECQPGDQVRGQTCNHLQSTRGVGKTCWALS